MRAKHRIRNLLIDHRIVFLCDSHAREVLDAGIESISALMQLTRNTADRRSVIERRYPIDRRIFPPRPEG